MGLGLTETGTIYVNVSIAAVSTKQVDVAEFIHRWRKDPLQSTDVPLEHVEITRVQVPDPAPSHSVAGVYVNQMSGLEPETKYACKMHNTER